MPTTRFKTTAGFLDENYKPVAIDDQNYWQGHNPLDPNQNDEFVKILEEQNKDPKQTPTLPDRKPLIISFVITEYKIEDGNEEVENKVEFIYDGDELAVGRRLIAQELFAKYQNTVNMTVTDSIQAQLIASNDVRNHAMGILLTETSNPDRKENEYPEFIDHLANRQRGTDAMYMIKGTQAMKHIEAMKSDFFYIQDIIDLESIKQSMEQKEVLGASSPVMMEARSTVAGELQKFMHENNEEIISCIKASNNP